ncbi:hypothetical protein [Couchioplanes azureus]|uniref:hypothetical protein n=1 Tax=Couchioplanes caeruleus TaxID=56438 RepID=UPI0016702F64|nr:hypothetical protein [Couchioplanes caeruleus]GGQ51777.1 hypothetical protein GCM10010166_20860 [Couchioplanes caeruleus subsp. azureus]
MSSFLPVLLLMIAGILVGGVISLVKQGATKFSIGLVAVLALLALAGGVLWMFPGKSA